MRLPFYTADVFTDATFGGAQVAVVTDTDQLDSTQMQRIAAEFNLWATVFVGARTSDNRFPMRMFSPEAELEFGSHAILAAAQVLAKTVSGIGESIVFQQGSDSLEVHLSQSDSAQLMTMFSMSTQPIIDNYVPSTQELADVLSLDSKMIGIKNFRPLLVANKGVFIVVPIYYLEQIQAAQFNSAAWNDSVAPNTLAQQILLFSPQTESGAADFHLRLLAPSLSAHKEPPVGAAIPAFSAYLCDHEHIKTGTYSFIAERGTAQTRQSLLHIEVDNKKSDQLTLRIGGTAVLVCEGTLNI